RDALSDACQWRAEEGLGVRRFIVHAERADPTMALHQSGGNVTGGRDSDGFHSRSQGMALRYSKLGKFVQAVKRGRFVTLGQSRVIENGIDEIFRRAAEDHNRLADVNEFASSFSDDMNAQNFLCFAMKD